MTAVQPPAELEAGIDDLLAELPRWQVPGLELAVVRDGATLFSGGVGVRGIGDPAPITPSTLFQHGSCTKAYTSLLATLLAESGVLDLDEPVRSYIPELRLPDPVLADRVTTRDLLSHRSGIGRHDLAWICNPSWDREEYLRRLPHLPLVDSWRGGMNYSNFGYALAGLVIERATGGSWQDQLQLHLLEPAGMTRTTTSLQTLLDDADHAEAHLVRDGMLTTTSHRTLNGVAPAGQIASCATDSARWLLLQLGGGKIGDDAVVAEASVAATHQLQIVTTAAPSPLPELRFLGYALGWLVGTFRGRPLLWHSGGVVGFLTQTFLLPEQQIGIVASANSHNSRLPLASVFQLADILLGASDEQSWYDRLYPKPVTGLGSSSEASNDLTPRPSHPLEHFSDSYFDLGYGELVIQVEDNQLQVRLGSEPLEAKHHHYDTWDLRLPDLDFDVTMSFNTDAAGIISEAVLPFDEATDPIRFRRRPSEGSE